MEPFDKNDIRRYLSKGGGGVNDDDHSGLISDMREGVLNSNVGPSVIPTVIPSHSSQDDDTYEVNTEVKRVNSHESMGEHYVMMRDVQDNDVEPTILPTHSSQADNKYDVKTEVGKGSNYVIMGEEHSKMINEDFEFESDVKPTTPPTQSSQDDNSYGVNTEVGRSNSYGMEGEHNIKIYDECESDVEPTSPPTQSSQDDDNFEVKTEVKRGSSCETGDEHYSMNVDMHVNTNDECEFINKRTWCKKHNCQVNKVTITSKKWQWIRSRKC